MPFNSGEAAGVVHMQLPDVKLAKTGDAMLNS